MMRYATSPTLQSKTQVLNSNNNFKGQKMKYFQNSSYLRLTQILILSSFILTAQSAHSAQPKRCGNINKVISMEVNTRYFFSRIVSARKGIISFQKNRMLNQLNNSLCSEFIQAGHQCEVDVKDKFLAFLTGTSQQKRWKMLPDDAINFKQSTSLRSIYGLPIYRDSVMGIAYETIRCAWK